MNNIFPQQKRNHAFSIIYTLFKKMLINTDSLSGYLRPIAGLVNEKYNNESCPAKVISIQHRTKKIYTLTLKVPRKRFGDFKAGQFVTLAVEKNGRRLQRTFSISSPPSELHRHGTIQLSISKQAYGSVTPWLCDHLTIGQYVHVSEARGEFVLKTNKNKLFIAAGSGLTPIISMLKSLQLDELPSCSLLYYVRDIRQTPFEEALEKLRSAGLKLKIIETTSQGHFSAKHIGEGGTLLKNCDAYLCGPTKMIESCASELRSAGANASSIHHELFTLADHTNLDPEHPSQRKSDITISYEKSRRLSSVTKESQQSLLELAEGQQVPTVSGCRIGVCHQCVCKKKQGRVFNIKTGEMSDSGEEEIQLCISTPVDNLTLEL